MNFISVSAAGAFLFITVPQYEASTTVYVTGNNYRSFAPIAYEDILVSQQLIKDYRELIKSRSVTKAVLEQLQITDLTPYELAKKITVDLKNETRILEIKLVDSNPERAKILADKLSSVFIDKIKGLMKVDDVDVVDRAEIPDSPVGPRPLVIIAVALIASFFLSVSIILILDYIDDTIKTAEDVEKQLGFTVLGTIPLRNID